jgi:hypothetical protein
MTDTYVHALVAVIVVITAAALRAAGELDNQTVSIVFGTALGFAAGRSGTRGAGL